MEGHLSLRLFGSCAAIALLAVPVSAGASTPDQSVQVVFAGDFTTPDRTDYAAPASVPKVHAAAAFQPAPMPDEDFDPPPGANPAGPSLAPAFFRHKEEFNGDGYASASDSDHGQDKRRTPAAGLNLSVPVK